MISSEGLAASLRSPLNIQRDTQFEVQRYVTLFLDDGYVSQKPAEMEIQVALLSLVGSKLTMEPNRSVRLVDQAFSDEKELDWPELYQLFAAFRKMVAENWWAQFQDQTDMPPEPTLEPQVLSEYPTDGECPVCYEEFEGMARWHCGHTTCAPCKSQISGISGSHRCPICRQSIADMSAEFTKTHEEWVAKCYALKMMKRNYPIIYSSVVSFWASKIDPKGALVTALKSGSFLSPLFPWDPLTTTLAGDNKEKMHARGNSAETEKAIVSLITYGSVYASGARWEKDEPHHPDHNYMWLLVIYNKITQELQTYHAKETGYVQKVQVGERVFLLVKLLYYGTTYLFSEEGVYLAYADLSESDEVVLEQDETAELPKLRDEYTDEEYTWVLAEGVAP